MHPVATPRLQAGLADMSAPAALRHWAQPYADLAPAWAACPAPAWLVWLAARQSASTGQRRAVVGCAVHLAEQAADPGRPADPRVHAALRAARRWAEADPHDLDLQAAADAAFDVAAWAAALAGDRAARARLLTTTAPRRRLASAAASRALAAWQEWRSADYAARLARAAAWTALAAATAQTWAEAPARWADCASQAAVHSTAALEARDTVRGRARPPAARRLAEAVRRELSCPASPEPSSRGPI